jgi:mRNA interferase RelE/StbE
LVWTVNYTDSARKELRKPNRQQAFRILDFMDKRIAVLENPRVQGKALSGPLGDLWRYRLGDYRIICEIQDTQLYVLVVKIGNLSDIYR